VVVGVDVPRYRGGGLRGTEVGAVFLRGAEEGEVGVGEVGFVVAVWPGVLVRTVVVVVVGMAVLVGW